MLLKLLLPLKIHKIDTMIEEVFGVLERNHRAYLSHRKKREQQFGEYT